jgi:hypothetical protein
MASTRRRVREMGTTPASGGDGDDDGNGGDVDGGAADAGGDDAACPVEGSTTPVGNVNASCCRTG